MGIKKLEFLKQDLDLILNDKIEVQIPEGKENNVDYEVREALLGHYHDKNIVKFNETGIKKIDKNIESVEGVETHSLEKNQEKIQKTIWRVYKKIHKKLQISFYIQV